ncbi:hypothetical protein [Flindersiella endophytica]
MARLPTALALGAVAVLVAGCATDPAVPRPTGPTGPTGTTGTTGDPAGPRRTLPAGSRSSTAAPTPENDAAGQQAERGDRSGSSLCVYEHHDKRPRTSVDEPPVEPSGRFLFAGAPGKRVGEAAGA